MLRLLVVCSALLAWAASAPCRADDWPQWMGPRRDGVSTEQGLLGEWPSDGPPRTWLSRDLGVGYGGPAVVGDALYIMGTDGDAEALFCLDSATGEERWKVELGEVYRNDWGDGPRGTPTVDGGRVYTLAARGSLVCVDARSGREQWRVSLVDDLGGAVPQWGYAESPLLDEGRLLVTPGGKRGAIAALDATTGKVVWRSTELADGAHYSSVVVAQPKARRQYTQLLEKRLVGIDPLTGALLWQARWEGRVAVIPTPLVEGEFVYATSGYGAGSMLVEAPAERGDARVVYKNDVMKNHHGGVVLLDGKLYGHSDGVGWVCQDFATGERVWRERGALGKGAVTCAGGRLYCLGEDSGEVVLVDPSPEGWRERGRFTLDPQTEQRKPSGRIWTHPVIAGGRLYLRDQELLSAYDVSAE